MTQNPAIQSETHVPPVFSMPFTTVSSTYRAEAGLHINSNRCGVCMHFATFPPHLDLPWFYPLAELAEGSACLVHVAEHYKSLPGDVLTSQGFLYILTQGRRIGHILIVLWNLPTQDHMAATVHLAIRRGLEVSVCVRCKTLRRGGSVSESSFSFANFGSTSRLRKANEHQRFHSNKQMKAKHPPDYAHGHDLSGTCEITASLMAPPTLSK